MITKENAEKYLAHGEGNCPACGGSLSKAFTDWACYKWGEICRTVACPNCEECYVEVFKLAELADDDGETVASIAIPKAESEQS